MHAVDWEVRQAVGKAALMNLGCPVVGRRHRLRIVKETLACLMITGRNIPGQKQ